MKCLKIKLHYFLSKKKLSQNYMEVYFSLLVWESCFIVYFEYNSLTPWYKDAGTNIGIGCAQSSIKNVI